jgi:hypothetical protein
MRGAAKLRGCRGVAEPRRAHGTAASACISGRDGRSISTKTFPRGNAKHPPFCPRSLHPRTVCFASVFAGFHHRPAAASCGVRSIATSSTSRRAADAEGDPRAELKSTPIKTLLNRLYLLVHPDLFSDYPKEQVCVVSCRVVCGAVCDRACACAVERVGPTRALLCA